MLSKYSWDNITQVKTLRNVAQEASGNIAQENIMYRVILILLRNVAKETPHNIVQSE